MSRKDGEFYFLDKTQNVKLFSIYKNVSGYTFKTIPRSNKIIAWFPTNVYNIAVVDKTVEIEHRKRKSLLLSNKHNR